MADPLWTVTRQVVGAFPGAGAQTLVLSKTISSQAQPAAAAGFAVAAAAAGATLQPLFGIDPATQLPATLIDAFGLFPGS